MQSKGKKIISQVAKMNGVSEEYVREEIRLAILNAYHNERTREKWNEIFGEGVLPTPEEFIVTMANKLKN